MRCFKDHVNWATVQRTVYWLGRTFVVALFPWLVGCSLERANLRPSSQAPSNDHPVCVSSLDAPSTPTSGPIEQVSRQAVDEEGPVSEPRLDKAPAQLEVPRRSDDVLFPADKPLSADDLIAIVLKRNPTLEQMRATAQAVQSRYAQVVALEDPMFGIATAPGSAWSNHVDYAARAEVSQKLPYPGKRELRGRVNQAESSAAQRDVDDMRLQLIESTLNAFADYYRTEVTRIVNADNLKILQEFRKNAVARFRNGQVSQQDVLQADLDIARLEERSVTLERTRQVAKARLNTLMHLPPDSHLPAPARPTPLMDHIDIAELRSRALGSRPDLQALANRLAAEEASAELALREYKPDFEVLAAYDGFWQGSNGRPLQWQVGARMNLPVRTERRNAAVAEAQARVAQRRAELARLTDQVNLQVQEGFELVKESEKIILLYEKTLLPAAEANIKEAQSAYVNGKIPFVTLIEAQRSLVGLKDRYNEAISDSLQRRASLSRAVGGTIDPPSN